MNDDGTVLDFDVVWMNPNDLFITRIMERIDVALLIKERIMGYNIVECLCLYAICSLMKKCTCHVKIDLTCEAEL